MTSLHIDRHLPADFLYESLARDARDGLAATPKSLPPKWFYDEVGSELFEQITRVSDYYLTQAEREILSSHSSEIIALADADTLIELGSGSSEKARLLLDPMRRVERLACYVPVDVSESSLLAAGETLIEDYPGLAVHAVLADFEHQLHALPRDGRRLIAFLAGTIGNFEPGPRARFLAELRAGMTGTDTLLVGFDLVKSPEMLLPAYADARGVTAAFNRNVLNVLNRELKADFDPETFEHVAVWDEDELWIEMRLRSMREQEAYVGALDLTVHFDEGEELRTEVSAKFERDGVRRELTEAGFRLQHWWTDAGGRFALALARPV